MLQRPLILNEAWIGSNLSTGISHGLEGAGVAILTSGFGGVAFNAGMGAAFSWTQGGDPRIGAAGSLIGFLANQNNKEGKGDGKEDRILKKDARGTPYYVEATDKTAGGLGMSMEVQGKMMEHAAKYGDIGSTGKSVLKGVKILGQATGILQIGTSAYEFYEKPGIGTGLKLGVNMGTFLRNVNPVISIGLGVADLTGVSDKLYQWTEKTIKSR